MTFAENLEGLEPVESLDKIELYNGDKYLATIPNVEGKKGSLQVYANILEFKDGKITLERAIEGLRLFDEHTIDANINPGKHPNIDHLFEVVEGKYDLSAILYRN